MIKIKQIKQALINNNIDTYKITETETEETQFFYVLQKLETMRKVKTLETSVTIFIKQEQGELLSEATFLVSHKISKKELDDLIKNAIYEAQFVKNKYYELASGSSKKVRIDLPLVDPTVYLQEIANIYIKASDEYVKFNSLELFSKLTKTHLVTSSGVDHKKEALKISIEAIPSYSKDGEKTELYRMFNYQNLDYQKIEEDAKLAVSDIYTRAKVENIELPKEIDVILRAKELGELFDEVLYEYSYMSVCHQSNTHSIGENITNNKIDLILAPTNKKELSDNDGVLLKNHQVVKNGKLVNYFGDNRFAYYLGLKPSGMLKRIILKAHNKYEDLKSKPHIELVDLSGLQVDAYANYLGGEVRLANYFDGNKVHPITSFSFSIPLDEAINNMRFGKEMTEIEHFTGPKYGVIVKAKVNR